MGFSPSFPVGRATSNSKLRVVMNYIRKVAHEEYDDNVAAVPCPTQEEWESLARGRKPVLPSLAVLSIYFGPSDSDQAVLEPEELIAFVFGQAKQQLQAG